MINNSPVFLNADNKTFTVFQKIVVVIICIKAPAKSADLFSAEILREVFQTTVIFLNTLTKPLSAPEKAFSKIRRAFPRIQTMLSLLWSESPE